MSFPQPLNHPVLFSDPVNQLKNIISESFEESLNQKQKRKYNKILKGLVGRLSPAFCLWPGRPCNQLTGQAYGLGLQTPPISNRNVCCRKFLFGEIENLAGNPADTLLQVVFGHYGQKSPVLPWQVWLRDQSVALRTEGCWVLFPVENMSISCSLFPQPG